MENSDTTHSHANDRRKQERRTNPYPFNSPEWIAVMSQSFVLWPKEDRRRYNNGNYDRRQEDRRSKTRPEINNRPQLQRENYKLSDSSQLTDEEMQYILDLFNQSEAQR